MDDRGFMTLDLHEKVVVITGVMRGTGMPAGGAGFHIGSGWILTAEHVWADVSDAAVWLYDTASDENMSAIAVSEVVPVHSSDMILLRTNFEARWRIAAGAGADERVPAVHAVEPEDALGRAADGMEVMVVGFPRIPFATKTLLSRELGRVTADPFLNTEGSWFVLSTQPRGGFSGGPVLNHLGRFLGVVSRENREDSDQPGLMTCGNLTALEDFLRLRQRGDLPLELGPEWTWLSRRPR